MHSLVCKLILSLDRSDGLEDGAASDSTVLVFLPTYRSMEELHMLLDRLGRFRLAVLHSSVDIEKSLRSIGSDPAPSDGMDGGRWKRKVILATNVAESSLTIPGVNVVIDLCRRCARNSPFPAPSSVVSTQNARALR